MAESRAIEMTPQECDALSKHLLECIGQSDTALASYNEDVEEGRALFEPRPERANKPWEDANELHVPLCEIVRAQQLARVDRTLLCVDPIGHVEGFSQQDRDAARAYEAFLQLFAAEEMRFRRQYLPAIDSGLTDGSCLVSLAWRQRRGERRRWGVREVPNPQVPEGALVDALGQVWMGDPPQPTPVPATVLVREPVTEEILRYDAPEITVIETGPVESESEKSRWGTYPAARGDVQQSTGVYVRYTLSGAELLERAAAGDFDAEAVEQLRTARSEAEAATTATDQMEGIDADSTDPRPFQWRTFDLVDCWWQWMPVAEGDGSAATQAQRDRARPKDRLITLHEDSGIVLQARANPWWLDGKRPLVAVRPFRKRFGVHGTSTPDLAGDAQEAMATNLQLAVDALQKKLKPPKKVRRGELVGREAEDLAAQDKPGGYLELDRPESVEELVTTANPVEMLPLQQMILQMTQRNTAVTDQNSGLIRGAATAREVEIATAEGDSLGGHVIQNLAEDMAEILWMVGRLCYQFVGNESVQRRWRQANPDREPEPGYLPGEQELAQEYKIAAWGVSDTSNRAVLRQQWTEVFPLMWKIAGEMQQKAILAQRGAAAQAGMAGMLGKSSEGSPVERVAHLQYAVLRNFIRAINLGDPLEIIGGEEEFVQTEASAAHAALASLAGPAAGPPGGAPAWNVP